MPDATPNAAFKPNEPGIFTGLSMADYRAAWGVAESDLRLLKDSPAKYHRAERPEETDAMKFGTIVHDSLFYPGNAVYHVAPETYPAPESARKDAPVIEKLWNWNAGFCRDWRESHADKPIIPREGKHSKRWLDAINQKVFTHPLATSLLRECLHEVSVFARSEDHPIMRKGRPDGLILAPGGVTRIVEVKTTLDASTLAFSREILKRGYHRKAAYYRDLLHSLGVSPVEVWFIILEKGNSPRVNVRRLAERAMDKGDFDNDDALTLLMNCKLRNFWPDFIDEPELGTAAAQEPVIDLPDYAYSASIDELKGLTDMPETPDEEKEAT